MPYSIHIFLNTFFSTSQIGVQKTSAFFFFVGFQLHIEQVLFGGKFCVKVILVGSHFHPRSVFIWGTSYMLCLGIVEVTTFFKSLGVCDPISYAFYLPFAMSLQVLDRAVVSAHSSAKVNLWMS